MKTVWKWVIGIIVVLVIMAVLVGGGFYLRAHMMNVAGLTRVTRPGFQFPGNRQLPAPNNGTNGNNGNGTRRMMPFGNGYWGGPGMYMGGYGMLGFGRMMPIAGLFGGLFGLGLLVLMVLSIIWLVRILRTPMAPAVVPAGYVNPVVPAAATHPCKKCGEPVQEYWNYCPNCGKKL